MVISVPAALAVLHRAPSPLLRSWGLVEEWIQDSQLVFAAEKEDQLENVDSCLEVEVKEVEIAVAVAAAAVARGAVGAHPCRVVETVVEAEAEHMDSLPVAPQLLLDRSRHLTPSRARPSWPWPWAATTAAAAS